MDKDEYIIINKTAIQNRIEELKITLYDLEQVKSKYRDNEWDQQYAIIPAQLELLEQILSQSTPLISEITKAWNNGRNDTKLVGNFPFTVTKYTNKTLKDYISNLKLDI